MSQHRPTFAEVLKSTPVVKVNTLTNEITAHSSLDERPFRIGVKGLVNTGLFERDERDVTAVVMVYHPATQQWFGVTPKDALSDRPLDECQSFAKFSQDRVERMLTNPRLASDVLGVAATRGVAIIDWVKREDL